MSTVSDLRNRRCVPCEGGDKPLGKEEIDRLLPLLASWKLQDGPRLERSFRFKNFREAIGFVNRVAEVAEAEGHHPDLHVHWNRVRVELWTHVLRGLSENDFILAAKIDEVSAGS